MEEINKIEWKQIEPILDFIIRLTELSTDYGEKYSYKIKAEYRKNEYVFGISIKCDLGGNLIIEDYIDVMFNDADNNELDISEIEGMNKDLDKFIDRVSKLKD